jgi:hypothetical protein
MGSENRSLPEAYMQGVADFLFWLLPIAMTGVVMATMQWVIFPPAYLDARKTRGEEK